MKSSRELPRVWSGARGARAAALLAASALLAAGARAADAPSREEAAAVLGQFRRAVWQEPTYGEFELREMPRHGEERAFRGRFWGSRGAGGPQTRFEVDGPGAGASRHLLILGGPEYQLFSADGPGPGKPDPAAMLAPVVPGVEITPFDLLPMPYLYWLDSELVGVQRMRGRQAYVYLMTPPADFPGGGAAVKAVRAYLDAQYNALEQSEVVGADGGIAKTLSLLELRKVGQRWIPKDLDVRTEATRNKTRLGLTAVAVGVELDPAVFDPARLGDRMAPPAGGKPQKL